MTDEEPGSLVLRYLRRIDEKVDRLSDDMREVKTRLGILEQQYASLSSRMDRLEARIERIENRMERIERRLDLPPAG